jgi:hypothetical protein
MKAPLRRQILVAVATGLARAMLVLGFLGAVALAAPGPVAAADPLCGTTITSNLTLTADVDCSGTTGTVLTVGADNLTIDGQGHAIIAPNAAWVISTYYHSGTTIRNVDVSGSGSGTGIDVWGSNTTIENVDASDRGYGISSGAHSVSNLALNNNTVRDAAYWALDLQYASSVTGLASNDISGSQHGISVGSNTTITGPWDLSTIPVTAIALYGDNNTVSNVDVSGSGTGTGISITSPSSNTTIENVDASDRGYGIQVAVTGMQSYVHNLALNNNTVRNAAYWALRLQGAPSVTGLSTNDLSGSQNGVRVGANTTITGPWDLTTVAGSQGGCAIYIGGDGSTVSNVDVSGFGTGTAISVHANNVTIENVDASDRAYGITSGPISGLALNNNTVRNATQWAFSLAASGVTGLPTNDISGSSNGIEVGNDTTITGPWDLTTVAGTAYGRAIQIQGDNNMISNVDVSGSGTGTGIRVGGFSNTIEDVDASDRATGIAVANAEGAIELRGNRIVGAGVGISTDGWCESCTIRDNYIRGNDFGLQLYNDASVYHNNIFDNTLNVYASAMELSSGGEGNYWGHGCPPPLFFPGVDSNYVDVVDSYPYASQNGWLFGPPGCAPGGLWVSTVIPDKGGNAGSVTAVIHGSGFLQGATVKLTRQWVPDIVAEPVWVDAEGWALAATFDLTGAEVGVWDVVVINPDGGSAALLGAFTVEEGCTAEVWVDILGPSAIRVGREAPVYILYGNTGNCNADNVPVMIAVPEDVDVEYIPGKWPPVGDPPLPPDDNPWEIKVGDEVRIPLDVPLVPPGRTGTSKISLKASAPGNFELETWTHPPLCQPSLTPAARACIRAILDEMMNIIGALPGAECMASGVSFGGSMLMAAAEAAAAGPQSTNQVLSMTDLTFSTASVVADCALGFFPPASMLIDAIQIALGAQNVMEKCWDPYKTLGISAVTAKDPNEKVGSAGAGEARYLSGVEPLRYAVFFANEPPQATAPAQEVVITDQLDPTKVDLSTFSLGPIAFGDREVVPLPGLSQFTTQVDLRPDQDLLLTIEAGLEPGTGLVTWHFTSIDPLTGQLPEDPMVGFLPVNNNPPEGEGSVLFTVMPKAALPTGTEIRNRASIVFDVNPPIETNEWLNTIDYTKPASQVLSLAPTQSQPSFQVQWSGTDTGSGILNYTIFVSENGGPYTEWVFGTPDTSRTFTGTQGRSYCFYSVARDGAYNIEDASATPDTCTTIAPEWACLFEDAGRGTQLVVDVARQVYRFTGPGFDTGERRASILRLFRSNRIALLDVARDGGLMVVSGTGRCPAGPGTFHAMQITFHPHQFRRLVIKDPGP